MNDETMLRVRCKREGLRSVSSIELDMSTRRMTCRIIPRCIGVVSLRMLSVISVILRDIQDQF